MTTVPNLTSRNPALSTSNYIEKRAKISAKPSGRELVYGPRLSINEALWRNDGLIFPYTPTINDTATVNYDTYEPIHGNQNYSAFKNRSSKEISVIGTFTTMNQNEAATNLSYLHFLRTVTQMYFGSGENRGTPPPVLLFSAYGSAIFNKVPVIITNYTFEMPADVDYVYLDSPKITREVLVDNRRGEATHYGPETSDGFNAWLPTRFTITVQMTVQNTPARLRRQFNLDEFRSGRLINDGGWI